MQATRDLLAAWAMGGRRPRSGDDHQAIRLWQDLDDVQGVRDERQKTFGQQMGPAMMFPLCAHAAALRPPDTTHFAEEPDFGAR